MKRATKRKPAPAEPLLVAPIPMSVEEPAVPRVPTRWETFHQVTAPMSLEKTKVICLATDAACLPR